MDDHKPLAIWQPKPGPSAKAQRVHHAARRMWRMGALSASFAAIGCLPLAVRSLHGAMPPWVVLMTFGVAVVCLVLFFDARDQFREHRRVLDAASGEETPTLPISPPGAAVKSPVRDRRAA